MAPPLIFTLLLLLLAIIAMAKVISKSAAFKGRIGEWLVRSRLDRGLEPGAFRILHDVTLPSRDGTTQIDHLVLSRFGIFTIETKHLAGWIFAAANSKVWTQTFGRNRKQSFQNPLRQNYAHIKALEAVTGLGNEAFLSLVVMTGKARFKTPIPEGVVKLAGLLNQIRQASTVRLTAAQLDDAQAAIEAARLEPGHATHRAHVGSLRQKFGAPAGFVARMVIYPEMAALGIKLLSLLLAFSVAWACFYVVRGAIEDFSKSLSQGPSSSQSTTVQSQPASSPSTPPRIQQLSNQQPEPYVQQQAPVNQIVIEPEPPSEPLTGRKLTVLTPNKPVRVTAQEKRRQFESELNCAVTSGPSRCECHTQGGARVLINTQRCMTLASRKDVEWITPQ